MVSASTSASRSDVLEEEALAMRDARLWIEALESCRRSEADAGGEDREVETVEESTGDMVVVRD